MKAQRVGWMVGLWMLGLAHVALAATGIGGLDAVLQTTDSAVGGVGYGLFTIAVLVALVTLGMGHGYIALVTLVLGAVAGSFIGNRADIGGMMNLSLGAELLPPLADLLPAWPLDLLP